MDREAESAWLKQSGIIVTAHNMDREICIPLAEALYEGGAAALEVTLNSVGAYYMLTDLSKHMGKRMRIGAGGVLDEEDAEIAVETGVSYLASPCADKRVIKYAKKKGLSAYAGALTPVEAVQAWKWGASAVRLFPASSLGPESVRELKEALGHIPMLAAGGIRPEDAIGYLEAGCLAVCLDIAAVCGEEALRLGRYEEIRDKTRSWTESAKEVLNTGKGI